MPCPTALVVLLSAVALHRIALGLALIVVFSAGLAAVLVAIGVVVVRARRATMGWIPERWLRGLPVLSALLVTGLGFLLLAQALAEAGVIRLPWAG